MAVWHVHSSYCIIIVDAALVARSSLTCAVCVQLSDACDSI